MSYQPCLLVMAGGTGGHIFPGLAVARALQKKGWIIHWLGTKKGLESTLIPKENIPLHYISIAGLFGKKWSAWLLAPFRIGIAFLQALFVLWKVKPSLVLGMGGFVSGPGGLAASLFRFPLLIHDQNAVSSMTNQWLAPMADRVLVAFPESLLKKAIHVGNPVREDIASLPEPKSRFMNRSGALRILVLGGSRGAKAINDCVPLAFKEVIKDIAIEIWHQTGAQQRDSTQALYDNCQIKARLDPFIDDMASAYAWADLIICRAGALTIAELAAVGVGSILIPFPFAIKDHQTHNAHWLRDAGAAVLLPQTELTPIKLSNMLKGLLSDHMQLLKMAEAARQLAMPKALDQIVNHCLEVSHA